ncbi:MAG: glucose-6-phosphate dehydrogenase, partial [Ghiorsea sp.]|nr:glucose-6-phosphate dehydrogenase [Ghiorsea sp.]
TDLNSAQTLNKDILTYWDESQVYRIDHYLGKEAVQNLVSFRFANGMFEPLWNHTHIDHIQITANEQVGVEWRGGYYDQAGVVRDMIQNHLFQMLAYLCMEPPTSFAAEAIRNEKHKLLNTVRIMKHEDVKTHAVRGQYDAGVNSNGSPAKAYRDEPDVAPDSNTETFAALKLYIDNWRWDGVPVYLRSGKGMSRKSTEIVVQFKQAPDFTFRGTPAAEQLEANQLIFRIQPKEGIELHFLAKRPGPSMNLRKVTMNFEYDQAFTTQPGLGYETMLFDCMRGDASLFSRSDLVETSWKIVKPVLDVWAKEKDESLPNYPFGSWGPKASFDLLAPRSHRRWPTRSSKQALRSIPIFEGSDEAMLSAFSSMLKSVVFDAGDQIVDAQSQAHELFIIRIGEVEVRNKSNKVLKTLQQGGIFGELSLLSTAQLSTNTYAKTYCGLYTMSKRDFCRVLMDNPMFAERIMQVARERYDIIVDTQHWVDSATTENTEGV